MGASIWEQLVTSFKFSDVILILLLCAAFIIGVIKGWQELLKLLGLESTEKRIYEETIRGLTDKITAADSRITALEASAKKFNDDRVQDREQSREYQHEYMDIVHSITEKQDKIIERVDALAEQNRKYELADIRETLLQAYRYYTSPASNPAMAWTAMESHAFWEQYDNYKERGGNGYMETVVKCEMNKLREIPLSDLEAVSELMESRHQRKC